MKNKKRLAAQILKTSPKKIKFAEGALEDIKKAITSSDIRGLIATHQIYETQNPHQSRARARKISVQKAKGRRQGHGSRKGSKNARLNEKSEWIIKVRNQRSFLKLLQQKKLILPQNYRLVYSKIKGGFFRNKRHLKLFLEEHHLIKK